MNTVEQIKELLRDAHRTLEENMGELTPEQAHWIPPGKLSPIDALVAHVVVGEDMWISRFVRQVPGLCETTWAAKTGVGEPVPGDPPWDEWAKRVKIDLPSLMEYAHAVYARTEEYLDTLTPEDLDAAFANNPPGFSWTLGYVLGPISAGHVYQHAGEISAVKGLQGLQGYSF